jgi:hypothetical protein
VCIIVANIIKIHNKRLSKLQLGIVIIVVAAALVAGYFFVKYRMISPTVNKSASEISKESQDRYDKANQAVRSGDYDKGQSLLDDTLNKSTTDTERSGIYVQKSTLALKSSKNDQAIKFANTAEKLYPSRMSAIVLAMSAEKSGDKALALKYYKLVVERFTEQERKISPSDYEYYQSKVKEFSS